MLPLRVKGVDRLKRYGMRVCVTIIVMVYFRCGDVGNYAFCATLASKVVKTCAPDHLYLFYPQCSQVRVFVWQCFSVCFLFEVTAAKPPSANRRKLMFAFSVVLIGFNFLWLVLAVFRWSLGGFMALGFKG